MSRMTDERLAEYVEAANRVPAERHGVMERLVYALKAERAKVAELEATDEAACYAAAVYVQQKEKLEAAEAQLAALPKWAQSSESKGQFYRKSVQEMAALREQLAALRKGSGELCAKWSSSRAHTYASENADRYRGFDDGQLVCAQELGSLLTKTTPTLNSQDRY